MMTMDKLGWWREARYGMIIHWGLYSLHGGGGCRGPTEAHDA